MISSFIKAFAIPCDVPVKPAILRMWDAHIDRLFANSPEPDEATTMSQLEFFQVRLSVYLRFFREERSCQPPCVMYEAMSRAGWPLLNLDGDEPVDLHLWTSGSHRSVYRKRCDYSTARRRSAQRRPRSWLREYRGLPTLGGWIATREPTRREAGVLG